MNGRWRHWHYTEWWYMVSAYFYLLYSCEDEKTIKSHRLVLVSLAMLGESRLVRIMLRDGVAVIVLVSLCETSMLLAACPSWNH